MVHAVSAQYQEAVNAETANMIGLPTHTAVDSGMLGFGLLLVGWCNTKSEVTETASRVRKKNDANRLRFRRHAIPVEVALRLHRRNRQNHLRSLPLVSVAVSGRLSLVTFFGLKESNTVLFALLTDFRYFTACPPRIFFRVREF